MPVSPGGTSATPDSPEYDHFCQTGCGQVADTIVVNLSTSDCDIQCRTCTVMMFVAVFRQLVESGQLDGLGEVATAPAP